jgi:hypothetical protein
MTLVWISRAARRAPNDSAYPGAAANCAGRITFTRYVPSGARSRLDVTGLGKTKMFACLSLEQGAHEAAIVSEDAAALLSDAVSVDELFVDAETASISLVFRQVREGEERQCAVARPF